MIRVKDFIGLCKYGVSICIYDRYGDDVWKSNKVDDITDIPMKYRELIVDEVSGNGGGSIMVIAVIN